MGLPRDRNVPPNTNGYYHCISRCVRWAWLCGYDKVNDIDFGYRRMNGKLESTKTLQSA